MKVKVIGEHNDNGKEFKVRRMNYDEVIVNYPTGTGLYTYKYSEVELISEGEIDDFLINNMEFLRIKLNRGISIFFYKALKDSFEEELKEELEDLNLLRDKYKVNKRGIWEKEIICVINKKLPVKVIASGQNFKREGYSISINNIQTGDFLKSALDEINKIKEEINRKEMTLLMYDKAIKNLKEIEKNEDIQY
ncbi:hypothetical protein ACQPU1_16730 [Clostridium paraputrificum]|uniref:hypothetical protein n=1 Tax=Clostridium TaxID=1485 RepID=UPI003D339BB3